MDLSKQTDSQPPLKTLALRKLAILQDEKQFWSLQRQKGKETARRVIERVEVVMKDGILELEGKKPDIGANSINDPAHNMVIEEAKDAGPKFLDAS